MMRWFSLYGNHLPTSPYQSMFDITRCCLGSQEMTHAEIRIAHRSKPSFECWNFVTVTSGLRIFQLIGSVGALILIGAAGSHFCATFAAMATSALASIASTTLLLLFVFNLQIVTFVDWIFWESLYSGSFAFLFLINAIVMTYSSIRWGYTTWWLATVLCSLAGLAFLIDLIILVRHELKNRNTCHGNDDVRRHLPTSDIY